MKFRKLGLASLFSVMFGSLVVGCGSDSDDNSDSGGTVSPPDVSQDHPHPHVFGKVQNSNLEKASFSLYWGIPKPVPTDLPIQITGAEVIDWLDRNYGGEAIINQHKKVWKRGNFSTFDVAAYAADEMSERVCHQWKGTKDCDLEFSFTWNPERQTHDLVVNGEKNWNHSYWYWSGDDGDHGGVQNLEYFGQIRMDETRSDDKINIGIHPVGDLDKHIAAQKAEVARLEANGGQVIIPLINVQTKWRNDPNVDFHQWYIISQECPGNPSNYCFSPDESLAMIDANGKPMSHMGKVDEEGKFSSCGITGGKCNDKRYDYTIKNLKVKAHNIRPDIYYDGVITMADVLLSLNDHEDHNGKHSGTMNFWPILATESNPESFAFESLDGLYASGNHGWLFDWGEVNNSHFYFNSPHIMPDKVVLVSPELIKWRYASFYDSYGEWQKFMAYDLNDPYKNTRHKVKTAQWPLEASHFGWKVADCAQCHTTADMDFECTKQLKEPGLLEPAKCAECHGANGASDGHLEKAMCVRCHIDLVGHGDALTNKQVHPFGEFGSGLSKTMSDPYSCVSCHQNEKDVLVGGK
ncbi:hypothetical protein TUM4433_16190 [Shewanella schlegeliana]|nr:hypothetical protein TUM4433_16190 [Shewanella schlegeliana]